MCYPLSSKSFEIICSAFVLTSTVSLTADPSDCPAQILAPHPALLSSRLEHTYRLHRQGNFTKISPLTWSSDGRRAFYRITECNLAWKPTTVSETLFSVHRDGSHSRKLYEWVPSNYSRGYGPTPTENSLRWSPDSRHILALFEEPGGDVNLDGVELHDFDTETGEERNFTRHLPDGPRTGNIIKQLGYHSFSPNGRYLLLTFGGDRFLLNSKRLGRIDYTTAKRKMLTSARMASFEGCWSPRGDKIAYISAPDATTASALGTAQYERIAPWKKQHLYVMDADGRHQRRLTHDACYFEQDPAWSADGRTLFFIRYNAASDMETRNLWKIRPDGTKASRVRTLPKKEWSPQPM